MPLYHIVGLIAEYHSFSNIASRILDLDLLRVVHPPPPVYRRRGVECLPRLDIHLFGLGVGVEHQVEHLFYGADEIHLRNTRLEHVFRTEGRAVAGPFTEIRLDRRVVRQGQLDIRRFAVGHIRRVGTGEYRCFDRHCLPGTQKPRLYDIFQFDRGRIVEGEHLDLHIRLFPDHPGRENRVRFPDKYFGGT